LWYSACLARAGLGFNSQHCKKKVMCLVTCWWLTPVILATQEAEIRRITVRSQLGQIVWETLSRKNPSQKRTGGVAQGVGSEFKPQYCKTKNNNNNTTKKSCTHKSLLQYPFRKSSLYPWTAVQRHGS
jgi:hypothetical protein